MKNLANYFLDNQENLIKLYKNLKLISLEINEDCQG